jgi:hypothetical protein
VNRSASESRLRPLHAAPRDAYVRVRVFAPFEPGDAPNPASDNLAPPPFLRAHICHCRGACSCTTTLDFLTDAETRTCAVPPVTDSRPAAAEPSTFGCACPTHRSEFHCVRKGYVRYATRRRIEDTLDVRIHFVVVGGRQVKRAVTAYLPGAIGAGAVLSLLQVSRRLRRHPCCTRRRVVGGQWQGSSWVAVEPFGSLRSGHRRSSLFQLGGFGAMVRWRTVTPQ